ncbi:MAG: ABC transporter substrate binding protein [Chloroflexota bacterium]|nr:ABC transporter substrate binding protein [Chloroflexota bacterium]
MTGRTCLRVLAAICVLASVCIAGCTANEGEPPSLEVLVVHSYHEGWDWNQDVQDGIVEGLSREGYSEGEDYELTTFYMDTKVTYTTTEAIEGRAALAVDLIQESNPDIVFVNDDNALKYVAVEYVESHPESGLPFVFSGVNLDPTVYGPIESLGAPGGTITGALERFPYYEAFSLARTVCPEASSIVLLADSSPSSDFVVGAFHERYLDVIADSPLDVIGPVQLDTFQGWQDAVSYYQEEAGFLGVMTYHQLRDEDGEIVDASEVVEWTTSHSTLPEMGFLTFHAEDGFLAACGASGYETGVYAGAVGGDILNGADPGAIAIEDPGVIEVAVNLARADALGITIPPEVLADADVVFGAPE